MIDRDQLDRDFEQYPLIGAYVETEIRSKDARNKLSSKTLRNRRGATRDLIDFLELDEELADKLGVDPELAPDANDLSEVTHEEIDDFVSFCIQKGEKRTTEATINRRHLRTIKKAYQIGQIKGHEVPGSPVEDARALHDYDTHSEADYPPIDKSEVVDVVNSIYRPDRRFIWVLGLKTGIRVSEMHNLDLQDFNIDYPPLKDCETYREITPRPEIRNKPDTLYISSSTEIADGTTYRGEPRRNGNKRENSTIVPLDGETKHALVRLLAARTPTENVPADPLFLSQRSEYKRLTIEYLNSKHVKRITEGRGWNDPDHYNDVTHKWFRHYFTTYHRSPQDGWGELYNTYFRGDKEPENLAGASQNPYTEASWLDTTKIYLENIYKFDLPTLPTSHPY